MNAVVFVAVLLCTFGVVVIAGWRGAASGSAALPGGGVLNVTGPFACSERPGLTVVKAGGREFSFSATHVSVDCRPVTSLASSTTVVEIDARGWSPRLRVGGRDIPIPK